MTREIIFENDKYYHIYNRGTDKRNIFLDKGDLKYFFDSIVISNKKTSIKNRSIRRSKIKEDIKGEEKLVSVVAYSFLPNHYHLIDPVGHLYPSLQFFLLLRLLLL